MSEEGIVYIDSRGSIKLWNTLSVCPSLRQKRHSCTP